MYGPNVAPCTIEIDEVVSAGMTIPCLGTFKLRPKLTGCAARLLWTAVMDSCYYSQLPCPVHTALWGLQHDSVLDRITSAIVIVISSTAIRSNDNVERRDS